MIQFQNYIVKCQNSRPLIKENQTKSNKIRPSLTFNGITFIAFENVLRSLMIQLLSIESFLKDFVS